VAPADPPSLHEESTTASLTDDVIDAYLVAWPTQATTLGDHRFDGVWPNLSPVGISADRARIDRDLAQLDASLGTSDPVDDPIDEQVDRAIVRNALEAQRFEHEVEHPWSRDPYWYVQLVGSGLEDLTSRPFASPSQRATSIAGRLEALPELFRQAQLNLATEPMLAPQTELARQQMSGLQDLVARVIPAAIEEASDDVRARVQRATDPALAALAEFAGFLASEAASRATGEWRLGRAAFERKLALTLQTSLGAAELRALAEAEHVRVRDRMGQLSIELASVLFEGREPPFVRADGDIGPLVRAVLDALAPQHTEPERLRDAVVETLARLERFVDQQHIVPLDPQERLDVKWTPPHQRGVFIAGLAAPGPLEAVAVDLPSFYYVQPVPEAWPAAQRESFLREYNDFMLEILSIHEAIPGHFVQLYYGKREVSRARRAFQNGAFVEGWAVYGEAVMVEQGYAGAAPTSVDPDASVGLRHVLMDTKLRAKAIALHGLKFYLRTVTNALLDYGVHVEGMTRDQALGLMIDGSFQESGEAEGKWIRAQVTSTQLSTYFAGAQAWQRLRREAEQRAAAAGMTFVLGEFHAQALSHGAPPMAELHRLLGWNS